MDSEAADMAQGGLNTHAAAAADLLRQAMAQKYVPNISFEQTSFVLWTLRVWLVL